MALYLFIDVYTHMNEMSPRPVPVQILMSLVNKCPCNSAVTVHFFYWLIFHDEEDAAVWARSRETVTVEVYIQTISCSCLRGSYACHVWNVIFIGPHTPWLGLCHNTHAHAHMHTPKLGLHWNEVQQNSMKPVAKITHRQQLNSELS